LEKQFKFTYLSIYREEMNMHKSWKQRQLLKKSPKAKSEDFFKNFLLSISSQWKAEFGNQEEKTKHQQIYADAA